MSTNGACKKAYLLGSELRLAVEKSLYFFDDPDAFAARVCPVLEEDEGRHALMLGLVLRIQKQWKNMREKPLLAFVQDESGWIRCSALMTPPHYLVVHNDRSDASALRMLIDGLRVRGMDLPGVTGIAAASEAFARLWEAESGRPARLELTLRAYQLKRVIQPAAPGGSFRKAVLSDGMDTVSMINAMQAELHNRNMGDDWTEEKMKQLISEGVVYVWDVEEKARAMAMTTRPTRHSISVSGVYTPPELRRRGYATALVASLSDFLLDQGYAIICLFTDLSNPTSNAIYQKIGYEPICDYHQYYFERK